MAVYHKQVPKGVRLKWAPLSEARNVSVSRNAVQGTWVLRSEIGRPVEPSDIAKHSVSGSSNKNYLIP